MIVDGHHQPLISMELWDKVQKMLKEQKVTYPKFAKREQPISYMTKGLLRCSNCGGTLAMSSARSGKAKIRTLQCCNYSRGSCRVSHNVLVPKIDAALRNALTEAIEEKHFNIVPREVKKSDPTAIDYDKLIAIEERRLERAKQAYLAEIDTIEQYAQNKKDITARIEDLIARRDRDTAKEVDMDAFAKKVASVAEFISREEPTAEAKNEALRTIIEKIVYEKAKGNLAIYFHDI